ncbi:unnamed protein product [Fusarium fujikuroi]|uniref:CCHC-type domain-containing protein n=1 Tax=Fusarium fujikuroi TaxID=5127 RepID=A0A9Q9RWK3_FUSFU|nr:unnamed protein product [Fusarium fujikuroi]
MSTFAEKVAEGVKKATDDATIAAASATALPASPKHKRLAQNELEGDAKKKKNKPNGPWCTWCRKNGHYMAACPDKIEYDKALREEGISLAHVGIQNVTNPLKEQIADLSGRLFVCEAAVTAANQAVKEAKKETKEVKKEAKKEANQLKNELKLSQVKIDLCISWITSADEKDKKKKEKKEKKKEQGQPAGEAMEVETEKEIEKETEKETEVGEEVEE